MNSTLTALCKLSLIFLSLIALTNCRRTTLRDNSLGRTEESMRKFATVLAGAESGWNVCIKDKKDNFYHFWVKFDANDWLQMKAAGFPFEYRAEQLQSADYVIRALQQPTLTFATYAYISELADPDLPGANGWPGKSREVDIQYAFSEDLVKSLNSGENPRQFTLIGRLHGSIAYFTKIAQGEIPVVDKIIQITHHLDALRWQKSNSVNIITGLDKSSDTWLYDLHTIESKAAIYPQSIAFTNLEQRKGAVFRYYYDCEGNFRLKSAGDDIPYRLNFYDSVFEAKMINALYKDFQLKDSTQLSFKQYALSGESPQTLALSQQDIRCICKNQKLQDHYHSDSSVLYTYDFFFRGFTKRNIRDIWRTSTGAIPGAIGYLWKNQKLSEIGLNSGQNFGDSTVSVLNIFSGISRRIYLNNDIRKGTCAGTGQNGGSCNNGQAGLGKNLAHFKFDTLKRGFFGGAGFFESDTPNVKWGKDYPELFGEQAYQGIKSSVLNNCYVMLATVLGFELHRLGSCDNQNAHCSSTQASPNSAEPSGLVIPLYLQYWAEEQN